MVPGGHWAESSETPEQAIKKTLTEAQKELNTIITALAYAEKDLEMSRDIY